MICHYHLVFWVLGVVLCCIGIRFWFSCQATDGFEWICNILSNCFQSFARGRENFLRKFELAKVVGRSVATFVCLEFGTGQRNGLELGMARKLRDVERTESNPYSLPDCTLQIGNYRMAQFFFFTLCLGTGSRWGGSPQAVKYGELDSGCSFQCSFLHYHHFHADHITVTSYMLLSIY